LIVSTMAADTVLVEKTKVDCRIDNAAPQLRYGNGKQRWRPEHVIAEWERTCRPGGRWTTWQPMFAEVWGPRVRDDGTISRQRGITERLNLHEDSTLARMVVAETRPNRM
jgi:hypothetical protein